MTGANAQQVIVVGAGPAGSATAYHLARAGIATLLIDKAAFPRDKVCGDCLSPRAQRYLDRMGLLEQVAAESHCSEHIRFRAPGGAAAATRITGDGAIPNRTLVLPRQRFDHLVQQQAVTAGVRFRVGHVRRLLPEGGVELAGERLPARLVVIATGAALGLIKQTPLAPRGPVHSLAARCYLERLPAPGPGPDLRFFFDQLPLPGYAWLFPTGPTSANLGYWYAGRDAVSASTLLPRLLAEHPELRALTAGAVPGGPGPVSRTDPASGSGAALDPGSATPPGVGAGHGTEVAQGSGAGALGGSDGGPADSALRAAIKGYPIRTDFLRAPVAAPGLLAVGEAAGLVNPFTGEGIDYALESAELAAEAILDALRQEAGEGALPVARLAGYRQALDRRFGPLFRLMQFAQRYAFNPWVFDRLFGRGEQGQALVDTLIQVCFGAAPPRRILQPAELARLVLSKPALERGRETTRPERD
ncbi:NAD(P)/FAD-dependent oxidoreductase [Halochromatium glycolicum]|uniref:NAD(P)/FAD-dependent oxidoreductase n=1 Tax=Halochromatium glycolicum TaxID=85075 RepID=UPI00190CA7C1|nr:NAD(P)/FAD-dependent oxidoreductase [Halochromatium glycolicum]